MFCSGALAMVRALARLRAERLATLVMEGIAVKLDRADVAAALLLQARPSQAEYPFSLLPTIKLNQVSPVSLPLLV